MLEEPKKLESGWFLIGESVGWEEKDMLLEWEKRGKDLRKRLAFIDEKKKGRVVIRVFAIEEV